MSEVSKRILVLEDNKPVAELLKFYFGEQGYQVKVIYQGKEFFQAIEDFKPDLVTIDIELPDEDGMELFRQLQANPEKKTIPVVFISIHEEQQELGLQLGAKGFILKPFVENELCQVILEAMEK